MSTQQQSLLTRQESAKQIGEKGEKGNLWWAYMTLIWGTTELVYAYKYEDSSPCNDGTNYLVGPQPYLLIDGWISVGWFCYVACCNCCSVVVAGAEDSDEEDRSQFMKLCVGICGMNTYIFFYDDGIY